MSRSSQFHSREPLQDHPSLQLHPSHVTGALPFLNPTRAKYTPTPTPVPKALAAGGSRSTTPTAHIEHLWRSRDNRKGRHALRVEYPAPDTALHRVPSPTDSAAAVARGICRMASYAPYWDVSYLVAVVFTAGSVIWIINAFFVWLPLVDPGTEFSGEVVLGGGISAFIGATVFEIGSVLLLLEAVNDAQTGCFGWALETEVKEVEGGWRDVTGARAESRLCRHHHANRHNLVGAGRVVAHRVSQDLAAGYSTSLRDGRSFRWWPSASELRSHYLRELGFLASLVQFVAASIFWIAGLTGLPGILDHMSQGLTDGIYWVPQIVGGSGFIISGLLFTLETQKKWYLPAFHVLGWHIGVWNLIGGIGFTLCGALGPASMHSGVNYQATLATFWGSWAFMIGSTIQWYESLQKFPVEKSD